MTLNAKKEIQGTIESVLSQTYPLIEYILIDGDSTDGTIDIVKTYKERISKLLVEKDHGVYDAMNKALSMATGDFLIFMNAGDKFVAEFTVENAMRSVRDPKAVYYGDALFVDPTQRRSYIYGGPYSAYTICSTNICHQSIFYPKAAYKNYSYDLKYRLFSDYAYKINLFAKRFKFVYLKDIVSVFRMDGLSSKEHDIVMCCRNKQFLDIVIIQDLHSFDSFSASVLTLECIHGHSLNVSHFCHGDHHIFSWDQIFHGNIKLIKSDGCSSLISIFIRNDDDFFSDYAEQLFLVCQNSL